MPLRVASGASVWAYLRVAYRVRSWGGLPLRRGPTLVVINHQHDLDDMAVMPHLMLGGPWRRPILTLSSRRQFEPGFFAVRVPWLAGLLSGYNPGRLFEAIGMRPIENQLQTRSIANIAWAVAQEHPDALFSDVFEPAVLKREGMADGPLSGTGRLLHSTVRLKELRDPFRSALIARTRNQIEADLGRVEEAVRAGATLYLAPEGRHSTDGRLGRFRGAYARLAPLCAIYLAPIAYDPFAPGRLSLLYRILPARGRENIEAQLLAARPVTVSQVLSAWLYDEAPSSFSAADAQRASSDRLRKLPVGCFVDPELRRSPELRVAGALRTLKRLSALVRDDAGRYHTAARRVHPSFDAVSDIIAYQANALAETVAAAAQLNTA